MPRRDTEFYEALLGLSGPWTVTKVELDSAAGRVDVWIEDRSGVKWNCPEHGVRQVSALGLSLAVDSPCSMRTGFEVPRRSWASLCSEKGEKTPYSIKDMAHMKDWLEWHGKEISPLLNTEE